MYKYIQEENEKRMSSAKFSEIERKLQTRDVTHTYTQPVLLRKSQFRHIS